MFSAAQQLQLAMTGKPVASLLQRAETEEQQEELKPALPKKVAQVRKKAQPKKLAKSKACAKKPAAKTLAKSKACAKKPAAKVKNTKVAACVFKPGSPGEVAHRRACGVPGALLQKHREGCVSCRHRPFCCNSCWKKRGYDV